MKSDKLKLIVSMVIFGTIGLLRRSIPCSSAVVAMVRGFVGVGFLQLLRLFRGKGMDYSAMKGKLPLLLLSGALIGFNWVCLFEAYAYTSVSVATVCYYMAPVFVILASPVILKEKLTLKKGLCALFAFVGMVLCSGLGSGESNSLRGVALALAAALMYASVILLNKRLTDIDAEERTAVQLFAAAAALLPYVLKTGLPAPGELTPTVLLLLLIAGVVHTGLAYTLYFGSLNGVSGQTAALMSYIDPVVAILLSALLLHEKMSLAAAIGAALVILSAIVSETGESE